MNEEVKKKNVLDLQFQKYLTIASTSVIMAFTYFVGIGISVLTRQIELDNFIIMFAIFIISAGVLGTCSFLFFNSMHHLKSIPQIVRRV